MTTVTSDIRVEVCITDIERTRGKELIQSFRDQFIPDASSKPTEKDFYLLIDREFPLTVGTQTLWNAETFMTLELQWPHTDDQLNYIGYKRLATWRRIQNVFFYVRDREEWHRLDVPNRIGLRLVRFLGSSRRVYFDSDCGAFLSFLTEIPRAASLVDWHFTPLSEIGVLWPGDCISLKQRVSPHEDVHVAIYLGGNLYLSKAGRSAFILCCSLEEMCKLYDNTEPGIVVAYRKR